MPGGAASEPSGGCVPGRGRLAWAAGMMMHGEQIDIPIQQAAADSTVRVIGAGGLDVTSTARLSAELDVVLAQRPAEVELDVNAVTFLSAAAAQVLWSARGALCRTADRGRRRPADPTVAEHPQLGAVADPW